MKEISLGLGISIPIERFAPLKITVGITEEKIGDETDTDLFNRATKMVRDAFEAETALQALRFFKIKDDQGLLNYAAALADDLAISDNEFTKEFLKSIKKNKE